MQNATSKRNMRDMTYWTGKVIVAGTWAIPDGYRRCAMTGKLFPEEQLEMTFNHHIFDRAFLITYGIYVEDADWLSVEGYDRILSVLESLGLDGAYIEATFNGGHVDTSHLMLVACQEPA